jgi:hypothetical protein
MDPSVRIERHLGCHGRFDRLIGIRERYEESIAFGVNDHTSVRGPDGPQQPIVLGQNIPVEIPDLVQQPRGALDVGEQQCHRALRQTPMLHHSNHRTEAEVPADRLPVGSSAPPAE